MYVFFLHAFLSFTAITCARPGNVHAHQTEPVRDTAQSIDKQRVQKSIKHYFARTPTTIEYGLVAVQSFLHPISDTKRSNEGPGIRQEIQWLSSDVCWKAIVDELAALPDGTTKQRDWTEYWNGSVFYRISTGTDGAIVCQLFDKLKRTGIPHDTIPLFDCQTKPSFLGNHNLVESLETADFIRHEHADVLGIDDYVFSIAGSKMRVRINIDPKSPREISLLEARWPDYASLEKEWSLGTSIGLRIESWMQAGEYWLPEIATRRAFIIADPTQMEKEDQVGEIRLERTEIKRATDEILDPKLFEPDFEQGWTIIDNRLNLIYIIGEKKIEIDGVEHHTSEPMHPSLVMRLDEIVLKPVNQDQQTPQTHPSKK